MAATWTTALVFVLIGGLDAAPVQFLDMSHVLDENATYWGQGVQKRPKLTDIAARAAINGSWEANNFEVGEHVGTHIDAPTHKIGSGTMHLHEIPIDRLTGPAVLIDIRDKLEAYDNNYEVMSQDLIDFESVHGRIPDGAIVVLCSGWTQKVYPLTTFWGTSTGDLFGDTPHFPGFGNDSATWLVRNRAIRGLASDTGSCDVGNTTTAAAHQILFEKNVWCAEALANTCSMPHQGATIYAFPMKIKHASGIPLRVVASWADNGGEEPTMNYPNSAWRFSCIYTALVGPFIWVLARV